MRALDIIINKRNGLELTKEEIDFFINGFTNGEIDNYQASALTMAIYFRGMTDKEATYLTNAMLHSGDVLDLSAIKGVKVDKHSTGGVGDKTTLVVGPLVASLGVKVAKMSGRGLGHTGGTLDKLEAIPGYNISLTEEEFVNQVNEIGIAVVGQTGVLAPADKKLYALRDVTGTVESIPLIASSIMSKKLASGSDAIVQKWMNNPEKAAQMDGWTDYDLTFGFYDDEEQDLYTNLGGTGFWPMTVIVDEKGVIRYSAEGEMDFEKLQEVVLPLLND